MNGRKLAMRCLALALTAAAAGAARADVTEQRMMPADPGKVAAALTKRGIISPQATAAERDAAVDAWLRSKAQGAKEGNPLARKAVDAREQRLDALAPGRVSGRKLGQQSATVAPSQPQWKALTGTDKLLLIAVEFSETPYTWTPTGGSPRTAAGPLHNQLPVPDNEQDLYVPNFDLQHYEDMLFKPGGWQFPSGSPRYAGETRGSMRDYYLAQSYGQYTITGKAYGWYTLPRPEAYYGDDSATGHDNLGPGTMTTLIQHAVAVVNGDPDPARRIPWREYDTNDDCIIDHVLFIHAGADQSGGGGAQGDDAIWAHSSARMVAVENDPTCTAKIGYPFRVIYNYTIMPEDGGVGVFAHEFGHDLGLPDEYDTIYSGRGDSVAFWSIMSSGSWVGKPAQTEPSSMSIWARYALGWLTPGENLAVTDLQAIDAAGGVAVRLEQSERWGGGNTLNALRVNVPPKMVINTIPPAGAYAWYGGKGDEMDNTLRRSVDLSAVSGPVTLSFLTSYDIEENWDYGFVQVSTDGGASWTSLAAEGMTNTPDAAAYPAILAQLATGPGFTGTSNGWVAKSIDLSAYAGKVVQLQFRYMTDWGTTLVGWYVDQIAVTAGGTTLVANGAETDDPAWTADGWTRDTGVASFPQYYMLEWRNARPFSTEYAGSSIVNFDAGLNHVYQYDPYGSTGNPNQPWYFAYDPGLVLWYRDTSFTDNWTGAHPGGGFLLVVDANPTALMRMPATLAASLNPDAQGVGALPWNTNVQSHDAAFGLDASGALTLGYWGQIRTYAGNSPMPSFFDAKSWWSPAAPSASVITPQNGFRFRVLGEAPDRSAAVVGLGAQ